MARVLIVDDKQAMRVMLEARLTTQGHAVQLASPTCGWARAETGWTSSAP
jgi:DNA-binding NtrC family response regulator